MNLTKLIDPQTITYLSRKAFIHRKYAIILIEKPKKYQFRCATNLEIIRPVCGINPVKYVLT